MPIQHTNNYLIPDGSDRLFHTWEPGQLIDVLAAPRRAFGCMGLTGPVPAAQISQPHLANPVSTAYTEDIIPDLTTQKPPPRTVPYQPPLFNLDRPTKHLTTIFLLFLTLSTRKISLIG